MDELQTEMPLRLSTVEGDITTVAIIDRETEEWLRKALARKSAVDVKVREPEGDVIGHQASADTIVVRLSLGDDDDDVVGHAMSLRFPDMAAAKDFERRMLATGLLVATVAAGAAGVGIASQANTHPSTAVAAPDPGQYAPAIRDNDRYITTPAEYAPAARDTDRDLNIQIPAAPAQYAPTIRDTDRNLDLQVPAQYAPTVRDTDRDLGIPASPAQYAPTVRDTDRNLDRQDASATAAPAIPDVHGNLNAPPSAAPTAPTIRDVHGNLNAPPSAPGTDKDDGTPPPGHERVL